MVYTDFMKRTIIDARKLDAVMLAAGYDPAIHKERLRFCRLAGVTFVTWQRVRNGYPWTSATLDALANALGVSSLSLLSETETAFVPPAKIVRPGVSMAA